MGSEENHWALEAVESCPSFVGETFCTSDLSDKDGGDCVDSKDGKIYGSDGQHDDLDMMVTMGVEVMVVWLRPYV